MDVIALAHPEQQCGHEYQRTALSSQRLDCLLGLTTGPYTSFGISESCCRVVMEAQRSPWHRTQDGLRTFCCCDLEAEVFLLSPPITKALLQPDDDVLDTSGITRGHLALDSVNFFSRQVSDPGQRFRHPEHCIFPHGNQLAAAAMWRCKGTTAGGRPPPSSFPFPRLAYRTVLVLTYTHQAR